MQAAGKAGARAGHPRTGPCLQGEMPSDELLLQTGRSAHLSLGLKAFFKAGVREKHHLCFECSWPPPDLSSAPLQEWSLDEGEDYFSPFISVIKCKRIRRKTVGFHPREARTRDWDLCVGESVEVRRSPTLA